MKNIITHINFKLLLLFVTITGLFVFAKQRNNQRKISKIDVEFTQSKNFFLDYEMVNKLLIENKIDTLNLTNKAIDLEIAEKLFDNHPMVEESEVYKNIDGVVSFKIKQKTPIARVFMGNQSYYLCSDKSKMPLSEINTERLLILTGKIHDNQIDSLYFMLEKIHKDKVLKENIISVEMQNNKNLILKNRVYDYEISFGKLEEIEKKLTNYKIFILKLSNSKKLEKYKRIELKYSKQVICNE